MPAVSLWKRPKSLMPRKVSPHCIWRPRRWIEIWRKQKKFKANLRQIRTVGHPYNVHSSLGPFRHDFPTSELEVISPYSRNQNHSDWNPPWMSEASVGLHLGFPFPLVEGPRRHTRISLAPNRTLPCLTTPSRLYQHFCIWMVFCFNYLNRITEVLCVWQLSR